MKNYCAYITHPIHIRCLYIAELHILLECMMQSFSFPIFNFKMGKLNILYFFSLQNLFSLFLMCMWFFLINLIFFLKISFPAHPTPSLIPASDWARKERHEMKCDVGGAEGQENQIPKSGCPFPFALGPARALDQKLYSKWELRFPQQKQKAIFPVTEVLCSYPVAFFQGALDLPAQTSVPGKPSPSHTLSCDREWTRKFSEVTGPCR